MHIRDKTAALPGSRRTSTSAQPDPQTPLGRLHAQQLPGGIYLTGCHGGAGISTLAALGIGIEAGRRSWPTPPGGTPAGVFFVARLSATGMRDASLAAEASLNQHKPPELILLGLIAVAAQPGRPPKIVRDRLSLVAGWMRATYQVPWVPEALTTDLADVPRCEPLRRAIPQELARFITPRSR